MTVHPDDREVLDRISAALAAEEPHLTGMYRIFSRLTFRDLIPDEDAVRRLPRRLAGGPGRSGDAGPGGPSAGGPRHRGRMAEARHLAKITAIPAILLAILITVIAFTTGGSRCTRTMSLHGAPGVAGVSCSAGAAPPPGNR
jgi:hypothetical protein